MKSLLTIPFTLLCLWVAAQAPVNDNCSGVINLGEAPYCSAAGEFTNLNATTSNIDALFNIPLCFNNNADRDVWFQFSLPADGSVTDITISVFGNIGGNGTLQMPQVALYRGDCIFGGLSELSCVAAPLNINELQLDFLGLNAGETYFLRVNDYSATGTPNWGTFKLCVEEYIADFNMGEVPGTQSCSGTLWDSGGEDDPYSSNENLTFTICPLDFHQCIQINILDYITEPNFDVIRIFEGNGTNGLLVAELDGSGTNEQVNVSGGGCATIAFESDNSLTLSGFQLTWLCTPDECPAPPPTPPSASTCDAALQINGCSTTLPNIISLAPGEGDPNFIVDNVNAGCILGPSQDLNFAFFYFRAQADGEFGFLVKNGDPTNPSDIDFSVWGPIDNPLDICDFVSNNQPVRSSWTAAPDLDNPEGLTGLTNINPETGGVVTDDFDCGSPATPGTGLLPTDDSFVKTLPVQQGKIYVVLLDDYDGAVESEEGISIDFSGSSAGVLDPVAGETVTVSDDISVCVGQPVQLEATGGLDYAWSPGATLSCEECPNPVALPFETTTYLVQIATVCALIKDSVTVSFLNLDLGPDPNVCPGASFTLNPHPIPGDYLWGGSPGLSCDTCPSPTFTATTPGIFNLVCIVTTPFCSDTDFIRINVAGGVQPVADILADTAICAGDMLTLGGPPSAGLTYLWTSSTSGSIPVPSNVSNPAPVSPTVSTTYYLEVTSPACFFPLRDSVEVEVYQRPVLSVIPGASFCFGDSVVLGNTASQPFVSFAWSPDDGSLNDITAANPVVTPLTPGPHTYTVVASNPGCAVTQSVSVFAVDLDVTLSVEDTVLLCKGGLQDITATITPASQVGVAQISWDPIQHIQISPDGLMATVSPEDNFLYTVNVVAPGGCVRTKKVFVKVDSLPQFLNISPMDTTICLGSIVEIRFRDGEPLYEPYLFPELTFLWTGDGQITTDTLPFVYVQPTDTVIYQRIATNGGCVDTVFATVNVVDPPDILIAPDMSTICPDSFIVLTAMADGVDSLIWSPANTLSCDDCLVTTATPSSTTTYTLSGKYKGCPTSSNPATVTVTPAPMYQFPQGGNKCAGEELTLNLVDDPSITSYSWTSDPPNVITSGDAQPTVTLSANGVKTITFFLEAFNGCTVKDDFTIQVTDAGLMMTEPDTICPENATLIVAQVAIGGGEFSWSNMATTQAISVTPTATTTYTVIYQLNGCSFQDSVEIVVQGQTPVIQFPADFVLCPGDTVVLNSVETLGAMYSWSSDEGGVFSTEAIPDPQVLYESTTYTVTATSLDGCSVTKMLPVTVFNPTLEVSGDMVVCAGEAFDVIASGSATGTYLWTPGNITDPSFTETLFTEQTVNYALRYTFGTAGNECFLDTSVTVQVLRNFNIKIVADPDSVVNAGQSIALDAVIQPSQSVNGFTFEWRENNLTTVGNTQQITVTPMTVDTSIFYTVIVVSPNGCTQEQTIEFRVLQPVVEIPNAFTPNGDGSNDAFGLAVVEGFVVVEKLEIYNRWGEKVYESAEPEAKWDGRVDGKDAPSDVYVYKIRYRRSDGSLVLESDEVTLLR